MRKTPILLAGLFTAVFLLPGQTPPPQLISLSPTSVPVGSPAFPLTLTGANFLPGAIVNFGGSQLPAIYVNSTRLSTDVPAALVSTAAVLNVTVTNPNQNTSNWVQFTIGGGGGGTALAITASALPQATAGQSYTYSFTATGGRTPYAWSSTGVIPPGLSLSAAGVLSGTAPAAGQYSVGVRVADAAGATATATVGLTVNLAAFTITTSTPLPSGRAGQVYSHAFLVNGGVAPYRWSITQGTLPAGLTLEGTSGVISGTPSAASTASFTVQAVDSAQATAVKAFTLTIDGSVLNITTRPPLLTGTIGEPYTQTFRADGGSPPYAWSISSGDTGGLTLDSATGTLQGTPRAEGSYTFRVTVTDSARASAAETYTVTIGRPALTITTPAVLPSVAAGADYTAAFAVSGGTAPYTWVLASGSVPGLTFDPVRPALAGVATAAGSYTLSVQVRDSTGQSATKTFTLSVTAAPLRLSNTGSLPNGMLTAEYTHTIEASGGVPPYTWVATGLPAGLTMDSATGTIRGTPTAAGQFNFTVRITDSARTTVADLFALTIDLPASPRVILSEMPAIARPGDQLTLRVSTSDPFPIPISGQAVLTFQPASGGGDSSIQFASGGRVVDFTIPAGATAPVLPTPLALQTGTVAGTITVTVRLRAGGVEISGSPAPAVVMRIDRAAPVIQNVAVARSGSTISIQVTGYSTPREVTQAAFTFAAPGLTSPTFTVPVEDTFTRWYADAGSVAFGSIFLFTQTFNIQGDATVVTLQSVTLTNRTGSTTSTTIRQ